MAAAAELKRMAGQVDVTIHALGILLCLPHILEAGETVEYVSLGAGNTGRRFDLETNLRIAEFKFIRWRGGPESMRQNATFKDFYELAAYATSKRKYLYLLGTPHAMRFFRSARAMDSVLSRNQALRQSFLGRFGERYSTVGDYRTLTRRGHPGGEIRRLAGSYTKFRNLRDDEFGTVDYRRSVEILKRDDDRWVERSEQEIKAEGWPTIAVSKGEFDGEWPFRRDCATVECRDGLFYVVNIGGYDFALNGAARSKYRLPFAHEAGVAVLGKSVGPFIDMAARLSP